MVRDRVDGWTSPADEQPLVVEHAHPELEVDEEALVRVLLCVLDGEGAALRALTVVLADHATVLELNRAYLGHDYHTDVVSFPFDEQEGIVDGEVYVDLDTARERHAEFGATFGDEVRRYVVHGLLHLIGYDDSTEEERATMQALEQRYLRDCNNPGRDQSG